MGSPVITTDVAACTGCRMCELACSYHHRRVFSPESSSIRIDMDNRRGNIGITIDGSCDLCRQEPQAQCVRYCCYQALEEVPPR